MWSTAHMLRGRAGEVVAKGAILLANTAQPGMVESLIRSEAVTWLDLQKTEDKVYRSRSTASPGRLWKAKVSLDNLSIELMKHVVEEGERATQDNVADHTSRPYVNLTAILLLLYDLWGQVEV